MAQRTAQGQRLRKRRSVVGSLRQAVRYPERARWYLHRVRRDLVLRTRHREDHLAYYGAVVDDLVLTGKATAVGGADSSS